MKSMQPTQTLFIATVYRPSGPYAAFLTEFLEFLLDLVVMADNIHIFDDLIFTWKSPHVQHVSRSTHCHSHNLDLVLSRKNKCCGSEANLKAAFPKRGWLSLQH